MLFFDILNKLKKEYAEDCIIRKNKTVLLHPGDIPKSRFMLFEGLDQKTIKEFLIDKYNNLFPKEYIEFLKFSNGANLFTVRLKTKKFNFAHDLFSIYGLPRIEPFDRPFDMEEPFDLRVEDFARHKSIPSDWLKCGSYIKDYDFRNGITDIFIDTKTGKIYSCIKNNKDIVDSWDSLDACFVSIYNSFADSSEEYNFK